MRDRFGVARCCCESFCEDCCNGNAPSEWDVDVTLSDSACSTCNELIDGTFTLARLSNQICRWQYLDSAPSWREECVTGYATYGDYITQRLVQLEVRCIDAEFYRLFGVVQLLRTYTTSTEKLKSTITGLDVTVDSRNGYYSDMFFYEAFIKYTDFTCNTATAYELPYEYSNYTRGFQFDSALGLGSISGASPNGSRWFNSGLHNGALPVGEKYDSTYNLYWKPICEPPANLILTAVP